MKLITCIVTGILTSVSGSAIAHPANWSLCATKAGLSALDKDYLKATAQSNLEEVQFEPVVLSHAGASQDKQFGRRMRQDHAQANAELKAVAAQTGYQLPRAVSEDQQHIMQRLAQFHGARFDAVYRQEMIHDHTEDIARTEREISLGHSPIVLASARKNLTLLQMHLKMSQDLPAEGEGTTSSP